MHGWEVSNLGLVGHGAHQDGAGLVGLGVLLGCSLPLSLGRRSIGVPRLARPPDLGWTVGDGCAVRVDLGFDSASGLSAGLLPG